MAKHRSIEETFQAIQPRGRTGIPDPPTISVGAASDGSDFSTALSQAGQQIAQLQSAYSQQASLIQANTQAIQSNTSAQGKGSAGSVAGGVASSLFGGLGLGLLSPLISGIASLFGGGSSTPAPLPVYVPPAPVAINAPIYPATPSAVASSGTTASGVSTPAAAGGGQPAPAPQVTALATAMASLFGGNSTPAPLPAYGLPLPATINATLNSATPNAAASNTTTAGGVSAQPAAGSGQAGSTPQITVNVTAMDSQSFMDHSTDIANAVREAMLNMHPINGVVASL